MNIKQLVTTAAFMVAISLACPSAFAITSAQAKAVKKAVTSVSLPEMPAKAAELVKNAAKADREAVAVTATRAAIYKSRSSAPQVVAAISKIAPDLAPAVARAASEMESNQAGLIARAASSAAPSAKAEIFSSVNAARSTASTGASTSIQVNTTTTSTSVSQASTGFAPAGRSGSVRGTMGLAADPVIVNVTTGNSPINTSTGGNGNGDFSGADADPAGEPVIIDYQAPRT
jgi:hypothetical protein